MTKIDNLADQVRRYRNIFNHGFVEQSPSSGAVAMLKPNNILFSSIPTFIKFEIRERKGRIDAHGVVNYLFFGLTFAMHVGLYLGFTHHGMISGNVVVVQFLVIIVCKLANFAILRREVRNAVVRVNNVSQA